MKINLIWVVLGIARLCVGRGECRPLGGAGGVNGVWGRGLVGGL